MGAKNAELLLYAKNHAQTREEHPNESNLSPELVDGIARLLALLLNVVAFVK